MMPAWGADLGLVMYLDLHRPLHHFDVTAKAVICWREQVLLLRRPNGRWDLPGGRARPGEHVTEALLREVREETGLVLEAFEELCVARHKRSNGRNCTIVSYRCTAQCPLTAMAIALSHEHVGFAFFGFEQIAGLRLRTRHKKAISAAWQQIHFAQAA